MKYSIPLKFIAFALASCALVTTILCALGIAALGQMDLYDADLDSWLQRQYRSHTYSLAKNLGNRYANRTFSDAPQALLEEYAYYGDDESFSNRYNLEPDNWYYTINDGYGLLLDTNRPANLDSTFWDYSFKIAATYLKTIEESTEPTTDPEEVTKPQNYDIAYPLDQNGNLVYLQYQNADTYTVTVYLSRNAFSSYNGIPIFHIDMLYQARYTFIVCLALSVLLFSAGLVFLCYISGKTHKTSPVTPGVFNRIPLDLYATATVVLCYFLVLAAQNILNTFFYYDYSYDIGGITLSSAVLLVASVILVGFVFALAAQIKADDRYWWKHSLLRNGGLMMVKVSRYVSNSANKFVSLLWRRLLLAVLLCGLLAVSVFLLVTQNSPYLLIAVVLVGIGTICYSAYASGSLLSGAKRMARGDLQRKIATKYLIGSHSAMADDLNTLADVAVQAAKKQMRSEHMKAELITNISHDIKTPLTSIINYVDLLEHAATPQEQAEYLATLGRQSQRLKKLIEDLMEMSKASSGSIPVEISTLDASEMVNQALGEFTDKLSAAQLTPVFQQPEGPVSLLADSRLTWRVLSNLLSNAVKYALPGTRIYVDLVQLEERAILSLKNISREPLNISAEELTERFVRGDVSRNTEGSGLGLNIAKSLMQLQNGHLQIHVDGDLFKATLVFRTPQQ